MYKEIEGDLIKLAENREFDIIAHCHDCSGSYKTTGLTKLIEKLYDIHEIPEEAPNLNWSSFKIGNISKKTIYYNEETVMGGIKMGTRFHLYTFYTSLGGSMNSVYGVNFDYDALKIALRKLNFTTGNNVRIGLPTLGCGSQGADWNVVKDIIKAELRPLNVTVVFKK
jgi:hypothetical protein